MAPSSSPLYSEFLRIVQDPDFSYHTKRVEWFLAGNSFKSTLVQLYASTFAPENDFESPSTLADIGIIPALIPSLEAYVEYWYFELKPLLERVFPVPENKPYLEEVYRKRARDSFKTTLERTYVQLVSALGGNKSYIRLRGKAGLVRPEQIRLIELAVESIIGEYKKIAQKLEELLIPVSNLYAEGLSDSSRAVEIDEFCFNMRRVLRKNESLVVDFLAGERFRSERIERAILGYLEDGVEVNWDVVRGLEEKDREMFPAGGELERYDKYRTESDKPLGYGY